MACKGAVKGVPGRGQGRARAVASTCKGLLLARALVGALAEKARKDSARGRRTRKRGEIGELPFSFLDFLRRPCAHTKSPATCAKDNKQGKMAKGAFTYAEGVPSAPCKV